MAIMQIVPDLRLGGVQTSVASLCGALIARGERVVLVSLGPDDELSASLPASENLQLVVVQRKRRSILAFPLFAWSVVSIVLELRSIMRRNQVTAVQGHMNNASLLGMLAAVLARVPKRFATFHSILFLPRKQGGVDRRNRLMLFTLRRLAPLFTRYIAVSDAVRDALVEQRIPAERVVTVANGVDCALFEEIPVAQRAALRAEFGLDERARVVLCVGTLRRAKGHRYLIEAAARLKPVLEHVVYLFLGEGSTRQELEEQIRTLGLEGTVRLLGARRDVAAVLSLAEVFVLPSLWEGLPIALLEAMAMGRPCVATRVAGTVEVLTDGETGVLVPPEDPESLAQGIRGLLGDRDRAALLGHNARRAAREHHGMAQMADRLLQLFGGSAL